MNASNIVFNPLPGESVKATILIQPQELKYATIAAIGPRATIDGYFEISLYLKDAGLLYTFTELAQQFQQEVTDILKTHYEVEPIERTVASSGWTWGDLRITQDTITFQGFKEEDDIEQNDKSHVSEENGSSPESEENEPADNEYFHIPVSFVSDFQKVHNKELDITFNTSSIKSNYVSVKSMGFIFPDPILRDQQYNLLSSYAETNSDRILLLEDIQIVQPSGKFRLEFTNNSFKISGSKEFIRLGKDILRMYIVEQERRNQNGSYYYLILTLNSKKRIVDTTDYLVLDLSNDRLRRDLQLPDDPIEKQRFIDHMHVSEYHEIAGTNNNADFGDDSLIENYQNRKANKLTPQLRDVPQFMAVTKLFQFIAPNVPVIFSETTLADYNNQQIRENRDAFWYQSQEEHEVSYVRCQIRKNYKDSILVLLNKQLLVLPNEVQVISYGELGKFVFDPDTKNSSDKNKFVKLSIFVKGEQNQIELYRLEMEAAESVASYIRRRNLPCQIVDRYMEEGGRRGGVSESERGHESEYDDDSFKEGDDELKNDSDSKYEYADTDEGSQQSDSNHSDTAKTKDKKKASDAMFLEYEIVPDVRTVDAIRKGDKPSEWASGMIKKPKIKKQPESLSQEEIESVSDHSE